MYGHEKSAGYLTSALIRGIQFVKCVYLLPKNLDFMRVYGSAVINTRITDNSTNFDRRFVELFFLDRKIFYKYNLINVY